MEGTVKKELSQLGIASICIDVFAILLAISLYYELDLHIGGEFTFYIFVGSPFIAVVLGIWGLFQKDRRKIFPGVGIALSFLSMIIVFGVLMEIM